MANKKDSYYFSHDYNARNDFKCLFLRQQLGMEGYGIYWFIVESLAESGGYLPLKIVPVLAMQMQTSEIKVSAVINEYDLFQVDENQFFSVRLNKHLEIRKTLSESGKKGAENRWVNRVAIGEAISDPNAKESKVNKVNKEKESSITEPDQILGINYVKAYKDLPDEFKNMYSEQFYKSWLNINKYIDEECKFLRTWENQITIAEFYKIYQRAEKREITLEKTKQALIDLNGSRHAKEKYTSVFHGFNVFIKTILQNV